MPPNSKGVEALRRHAARHAADTHKRIARALRDLTRAREPININAVARRAGVTRTTIYRHTDLAERIIRHRDRGPGPRPLPDPGADAYGDGGIVAALRHELHQQQTRHATEVRQLNARIQQQNNALAAAHGELQRLGQSIRPDETRS